MEVCDNLVTEKKPNGTTMTGVSGPADVLNTPVKRKNVKPEIRKKLLSSLRSPNPDNPFNSLLALVEPDCFRISVCSFQGGFKAQIIIDGRIFVSFSMQKKKARDMVVIKALHHVFADVLQRINNGTENDSSPVQVLSNTFTTSSEALLKNVQRTTTPETVSNKRKRVEEVQRTPAQKRAHETASDENENSSKKAKLDSFESLDVNPHRVVIRKEIKEPVLERVVLQALGLINPENSNTVTALHCLFEKDSFSFSGSVTPNADGKFEWKLNIQGREYTGTDTSIKKSKIAATKLALRDLFPKIAAKCENHEIMKDPVIEEHITAPIPSAPVTLAIQTSGIADQVASAIRSKYDELVAPYEEHLRRYSIISGIVMVEANDTMQIICITTGNKCIRGDQVTTHGDVVFDCHAEVLAKRCLRRFLYSQLELTLNAKTSIFEKVDENRFRIRECIKFYLYVNSAPCGDGRVFNFSPTKKLSNKKLSNKRGILRVKLESGMGGIPVTEYADMTSTYEGYLRGRPFVVMCCSEKLMRANVLGTQGALLSQLVEPVYFEGILIGDVFEKDNVERALHGRVAELDQEQIPVPYRVHKPFVEGVSDGKVVTNVKAGKSCMNWIICDPEVEFLNTKTGKTLDDKLSRICKFNLFVQFVNLYGVLVKVRKSTLSMVSYEGFKQKAATYQQIRKTLFEFLEKNGRGKWVRKPRELNAFLLQDDDLF